MTIFSLDEATIVNAMQAITGVERVVPELSTEEGSTPGRAAQDGETSANASSEALASAEQAGDSLAHVAERFARATFSGIAEPGDLMAGTLVRGLGATDALTALVERHPAQRIVDRLTDAGVEGATLVAVASALERWQPRIASNSALTSLQLAARCGARLVTPGDDEWPATLFDLGEHEPLALWVRAPNHSLGRLRRSVALVGARAASGYGEHVAMEFSAGLSDRGVGVVSGAAYGIDGMAHRAALASSGFTAAFLAGGVDRFYPSGHDSLLARIVREGAVISELPCGSPPTKWRFLQRNRLIAAASRATVVVEAGSRSGSLNTAAHAASIGRPLGAVPGPVTSASSAGCHRLLREFAAECVTTVDEVVGLFSEHDGAENGAVGLTAVGHSPTAPDEARSGVRAEKSDRESARSAEEVRALDALSSRTSRGTEDIAKRAGLGVDRTRAVLGMLEVAGRVRESDRGWKKIEP